MSFPGRSFLGGLDETEVETLSAAGRRVGLDEGEFLCVEGDRAGAVWFVLEGSLKLTKVAESGREAILEFRGPGDVLGEMGAVDDQPRSASAVAVGHVEVLAVPGARVRELLGERPALGQRLAQELVARLRQASARQLELGTMDVVGRVARRLVELAAVWGTVADSGVLIQAGISQQELAEWAGTSRDSVVRALRELRAGGYIESGRTEVLVRDLAGLAALAAMPSDA